jgi:hypothetical protein
MKILSAVLFFTLSFQAFALDYLFMEGNQQEKIWSKYTNNPDENLSRLIRILTKSRTGKRILKLATNKAQDTGRTLEEIFEVGNGSLTDTTLTRRFSASNPMDVVYESKSKVFINESLSVRDAILDMAHELTHFIFRVPFNPYTQNFTLSDFIHSTVQGRGGEVDAFVMECNVMREIFPKPFRESYNCRKILDKSTGLISKAEAIKRFYQVGNYYSEFTEKLEDKGIKHSRTFPLMNSSQASFISSAYGLPYPVAAYKEYLSVLQKACSNDKNRMGYIKRNQQRNPASMTALTLYREFQDDYKRRCQI